MEKHLNFILAMKLFDMLYLDTLDFINGPYSKKAVRIDTREKLDLIIRISSYLGFITPDTSNITEFDLKMLYLVFSSYKDSDNREVREVTFTNLIRLTSMKTSHRKVYVIYSYLPVLERFILDQIENKVDFSKRTRKYYIELEDYDNYKIKYCYKEKENVRIYFPKKESLMKLLDIELYEEKILFFLLSNKNLNSENRVVVSYAKR